MRPHFRSRAAVLAAALALVAAAPVHAQGASEADRRAVLATVQKVFEAMRTRDTSLLRVAFDTSARLGGVAQQGGSASIRNMTHQQFGAAIAGAPAGDVWVERIFDPEVRIDGEVAQVWAYYTFHRNGTFSHCGVDAFTLLKVGAEWKISYLADSRRKTGCTHTESPAD